MAEEFNIRDHPLTSREKDYENALRPLNFEDFSGQKKVVDNLRVFVQAARLRGDAEGAAFGGQELRHSTETNPCAMRAVSSIQRAPGGSA